MIGFGTEFILRLTENLQALLWDIFNIYSTCYHYNQIYFDNIHETKNLTNSVFHLPVLVYTFSMKNGLNHLVSIVQ